MFRILFTGLLAATCLVTVQSAKAQDKPLAGYADNSPIVLNGVVEEVRDDEFVLSYGTGNIDVDMDSWDSSDENITFLKPGDKVTVSGRIDDDLFDGRKIEANNIYLENAYVYYYQDDGRNYPAYYMSDRQTDMRDGTFVSMRGTISEIAGKEFTVSGPSGNMQVDASNLGYNPFDDEGLQRLRVGDRVHVYGNIDDDFFERREIMADGIVTLTLRETVAPGAVN